MALNYLPFLNNPVRKPTGHEPLATFTEKLPSLAQNYNGLPIPKDTRPVFAGADKGPRALVTMPHRPPPAARSDLPLPFTTLVVNANALHVPDLVSMAEDESMRRKEKRLYETARAYVPMANPAMGLLYNSEIASLEGRINEITAGMMSKGAKPEEIDAALARDYAHLREMLQRQEQAESGVTPTMLRTERLLMSSATVPSGAMLAVQRARESAAAVAGVPVNEVMAGAGAAERPRVGAATHAVDASPAAQVAKALAGAGASNQAGGEGGALAITAQNGTPSASGYVAANAARRVAATPGVPPSTADSGASAWGAISAAELAVSGAGAGAGVLRAPENMPSAWASAAAPMTTPARPGTGGGAETDPRALVAATPLKTPDAIVAKLSPQAKDMTTRMDILKAESAQKLTPTKVQTIARDMLEASDDDLRAGADSYNEYAGAQLLKAIAATVASMKAGTAFMSTANELRAYRVNAATLLQLLGLRHPDLAEAIMGQRDDLLAYTQAEMGRRFY